MSSISKLQQNGQQPNSKKLSSSSSTIIDLDPKTNAVLQKKNYKVTKKLAQGAFGQVFQGVRGQSELVAIKVMELSKINKMLREKYIPRELAALIDCRHDNVIEIFDIIRSNNRLYIFMEFAPNGDLSKYIKKNGALTEKQAREWFNQVIQALSYAHQHLRIAHRDIKLDNVLLDKNFNAKLADFGLAKDSWDSKKHCVTLSSTVCGTEPYFSPQILQRIPYNPYLSDVWAMGVMLYAMLHGHFPFSTQDPNLALLEQTNYPAFIRSVINSKISDSGSDFITKIFDPNEKTRITLHEAIDHHWLLMTSSLTSTQKI